MFHTPKSNQEITDWVMQHTPEEQVHLLTLWGMVCNYYAYIINQLAEEVQNNVSDDTQTESAAQTDSKEP